MGVDRRIARRRFWPVARDSAEGGIPLLPRIASIWRIIFLAPPPFIMRIS